MIDETRYEFDDFQEKINSGNFTKVYHCTDKNSFEGLKKMGFDREYVGKNSKVYGNGVYTTFTLQSSERNSRKGPYGNYILECVLIDGFKDFVFFDEKMNQRYNNGEPIISQLKRLLPQDLFNRVRNDKNFDYITNFHHSTTYSPIHGTITRSAPMCMDLVNILLSGHGSHRDETDITRTKIRGYIFVGMQDGEVCVVRDFKALIPVRVCKGKNPYDEKNWESCFNEKLFNSIMDSHDAGYKLTGLYPLTNPNEKTVCGFCMVRRSDGKYNYFNVESEKELLPVWAEKAFPFNLRTETAKCVINGKSFIIDEYSATDEESGMQFSLSELPSYLDGSMEQRQELESGDDEFSGMFDDFNLFESVFNEVIDEDSVDEIINVDYDSFKDRYSRETDGVEIGHSVNDNKEKLVHLWHCTGGDEKSLLKVGLDSEFRGGEARGKGAYTHYTLNSARSLSGYGNKIIDFVLNDGFKDFLFFQSRMNSIYNDGESLYNQYKRMMPKDMFDLFMQYGGENCCSFNDNSCSAFLTLMSKIGQKMRNNGSAERYRGNSDDAEFALSKTKIRGWVDDYFCGQCVIVRNYKDLIPVAVSRDRGRTFNVVLNRDNFENLANQEDIGVRFRGKYPKTSDREKIICDFLRVRREDGKYNYVNVHTMEELLPVWADEAIPFSLSSEEAKFSIGGRKFITDGYYFYEVVNGMKDNQIPIEDFADYLAGKKKEESTNDEFSGMFDDFDFGGLTLETKKIKNLFSRIDEIRKRDLNNMID